MSKAWKIRVLLVLAAIALILIVLPKDTSIIVVVSALTLFMVILPFGKIISFDRKLKKLYSVDIADATVPKRTFGASVILKSLVSMFVVGVWLAAVNKVFPSFISSTLDIFIVIFIIAAVIIFGFFQFKIDILKRDLNNPSITNNNSGIEQTNEIVKTQETSFLIFRLCIGLIMAAYIWKFPANFIPLLITYFIVLSGVAITTKPLRL